MAEMFHLGFEIDTRPLAQVSTDAAKAVDAVSKLGEAERKLNTENQKTADTQRKVNEETAKGTKVTGENAKATEEAAKAKRQAADSTASFEEKLKTVSGSLRVNQQDLQGLAAMLRGQSGLVGGLEGASGALTRMVGVLGPVGVAIGAVAVGAGVAAVGFQKLVTPLAEAQDQAALFTARMQNALGSSSAAADTMKQLYEATQKTGLGFRDTADAFLRIARNGDRLGATTEQLLQLTDTIQKLGAVSGASRGEIGSGMLQLSQALAAGKLNGDELRSIMENMPALAKAIADGLGVGVGQMRAMGAAGELTSSKVFTAILKASEQANREFASLPETMERANQRSIDAWDNLLATMGERWNASSMVRGVKNWFTDLINGTAKAIEQAPMVDRIAQLQAQRNAFAANPLMFGGDVSGRIKQIDQEIVALRANLLLQQQQKEVADRSAEEKRLKAPVLSAAELGSNDYDDYSKKLKKATEDADRLQKALDDVRTNSVFTQGERDTLIPALSRQLGIARAELDGMVAGLEKVRRDLSDSRLASLIGGGGGGTGIVAQAQQQLRQAREKGLGGSLQDFIGVGIAGAVDKGGDQIAALMRQVESQRTLAAAVGQSRSAVVELEVANDVLSKRFDLFGKLTGPAITQFLKQYEAALRQSKAAADDLANAQARLGLRDQIDAARASLDNVGNPYAGRLAANELRAGIAARRDPVQAQLQRDLFGIQEQTNARNQIDTADRNAQFNRSVIGMSPAAVRDAELARRIADAQRNAAPDQRDAIGAAIRGEDASSRAREYDAQEQALQRQMKLLQDRKALMGLMPDEYRVQNALLEKRNQLEQAGAPKEVIDRQLQITELLERQTIAYEKQKRGIDGIVNAFVKVGDGIEMAFRDSIEKGLGDGTRAGLRQFEYSFRSAIRKMGAELTYEIGVRPFVEMMRNMAQALGNRLIASLFGSLGGGSMPTMSGTPSISNFAALGMGFDTGGVRRFATGGAFTNSIVDSPTMFAFAKGGALGLMGEAGPEAIMPLKRGSDGSLGVRATGGDVQVVINDMRQSTEAPPIQVAESRGPDNRRVLQIMVRDEVRRVVRSGELDTEMFSNFGVSRSVARK
jgi:tape measure domain-containing protein